MQEAKVTRANPLCIYGCLLCLLQFGPHITKLILMHHVGATATSNVKLLAAQLHARLEIQATGIPEAEGKGHLRMEVDQMTAQRTMRQYGEREIIAKCFQSFEQICLQLSAYLSQNQTANAEELAQLK